MLRLTQLAITMAAVEADLVADVQPCCLSKGWSGAKDAWKLHVDNDSVVLGRSMHTQPSVLGHRLSGACNIEVVLGLCCLGPCFLWGHR